MAYYIITPREGGYRAQVRVKTAGRVVHTESRTFEKRAAAEAWGKRRVLDLEERDPADIQAQRITVGAMLRRYIDEYGELSKFGRTKRSALNFLAGSELADVPLSSLTASRVIRHVRERREGGAGPCTVKQDLVWLRIVAKVARVAWGLPVSVQAIEDAALHAKLHRMIGTSKRRERRPTAVELQRLSEHFDDRSYRASIPMHDIMWFAIHSARREGEITRLAWADNNEAELTGVVRDAKHPTRKEGNHRTFKYTREAWEIVKRQPRTGPLIFPYNAKSIGTAFTRACHILEIPDLRFHDLRHEGTSRLFEAGYSIVEVQQFTLHESWDVLKRYVQLRPGQVQHRTSPGALSPSTRPDGAQGPPLEPATAISATPPES